MEVKKGFKIKINDKILDVVPSSKSLLVHQWNSTPMIEVEFPSTLSRSQFILINSNYLKTECVCVLGNELSAYKIEKRLTSLGESAVSFITAYSDKGFTHFFIETSGFDKRSILYLYNYIKYNQNDELNKSFIILIDNKAYHSLFEDNEIKFLLFDDINLAVEQKEFKITNFV